MDILCINTYFYDFYLVTVVLLCFIKHLQMNNFEWSMDRLIVYWLIDWCDSSLFHNGQVCIL